MKKNISIVLALTMTFMFMLVAPAYAAPDAEQAIQESELQAQGAVLIDARSGKVLYGKNKDEKLYPASTTKVMTALVALEKGKLDDVVTADKNVYRLEKGSSIIGLKPGETMTLEQLLYGLLLQSGNDAAVAIAIHIGGSIDGFSDMMNAKAKELGLTNSHFINPHGLYSPEHYTTPYDLARIAMAAMKNPKFREIVGTYRYQMPPTNLVETSRTWTNHNRLISQNQKEKFRYEYATGIKTGYTIDCGHALVSSAKKGDTELIVAVMKDNRDGKWTDSIRMFDWGFENFESFSTAQIIAEKQEKATVQVAEAASDDAGQGRLELEMEKLDPDQYYTFSKNEPRSVTTETSITPSIKAPVKQGQVLGNVSYKLNGELLFKVNLVASRVVNEKKATGFKDIQTQVKGQNLPSMWWLIPLVIIVVGLISHMLYRRYHRRRNRYHNNLYFRR